MPSSGSIIIVNLSDNQKGPVVADGAMGMCTGLQWLGLVAGESVRKKLEKE